MFSTSNVFSIILISICLLSSCQKENSLLNNEKPYAAANSSISTVASKRLNTSNDLQIGTQVWSRQNLNVTQYRNGDIIPHVTDNSEWVKLSSGAWCWYNNDSTKYWQYGKLYNWYAVNDPRGLAPTGWHIPTDAEWNTLVSYLSGPYIAGGALKETGTAHWNSPNAGATNSTGFTGLPGGYRFASGQFNFIGLDGYWWTTTSQNSSTAWYYNLYYKDSKVYHYTSPMNYGFSLRLIKN